MIVIDASSIVGAAIRIDSVPERALFKAVQSDIVALSVAVDAEISSVLARPKLASRVSARRRSTVLGILRRNARWFEPLDAITDCRDPKDDKYLELALVAEATSIMSSDNDLLVLNPWRGIRIHTPAEYLAA